MRRAYNAMKAVLEYHKGLGLAGPQIGYMRRAFIIRDLSGPPIIYLNPEIIEVSPHLIDSEEACLSDPGNLYTVPRHEWVTIRHATGSHIGKRFEGLDAIIVQHEIDHLNGINIRDKGKKI